jgi:hypothetical protein
MFNVISILIALLLAVVLWLNVIASLAILRDSLSSSKQKTLQLIVVWFLPLMGALTILGIHRPDEKFSGKYPEEILPPEDIQAQKRGNQVIDDE